MEREVVKVFDTTLRDGEQSPGATMNIEEKVSHARRIVASPLGEGAGGGGDGDRPAGDVVTRAASTAERLRQFLLKRGSGE